MVLTWLCKNYSNCSVNKFKVMARINLISWKRHCSYTYIIFVMVEYKYFHHRLVTLPPCHLLGISWTGVHEGEYSWQTPIDHNTYSHFKIIIKSWCVLENLSFLPGKIAVSLHFCWPFRICVFNKREKYQEKNLIITLQRLVVLCYCVHH